MSRFRRATIVAPHPDDETIAAFGLIRALVRAGVEVTVKVATDGAASHPASKTWPPERLVAARQREVVASMKLAGLSRGQVEFLNFPDGGLATLCKVRRMELVKRLSAGPAPDLVVRPSLYDLHPDHVAVAQACLQAWTRRIAQASYIVWPRRLHEAGAQRFFIGADRTTKSAAMRLFRTQTTAIQDDPAGFTLDNRLLQRFVRPTEVFCFRADARNEALVMQRLCFPSVHG